MRRRDLDLGMTSTAILVCDPRYNCDCRSDYQIGLEASDRDGLPANQRAQRDSQKEGAVVPGQYRCPAVGELVRQPELLSREKQLRRQ
jgi:hypothetical protein